MQILLDGYNVGKYYIILMLSTSIVLLCGTKLLDVPSPGPSLCNPSRFR
jgi:hypothetical protein